ncbi:hypothetical protein [Roseomonas indoligenes]|uniref:Uncharacterized protein n=1 Tax=Roseomonas indoligenes TaxID=2820811 RepID=A0A940S885_9PROT|nr:hypothetical protein [Pararoseomonas indoligenes]MBP0493842.1 hypothetical protein [Pararoseomonas indoligenes]
MNPPPPGGDLPRPVALLLASTALLATLAYLFWPPLSTGFRLFTGDRFDGFIALAVHEHWWHALRGLAPVTKVAWFHPWPGTLAYNDGYLLHGLLYAPLRALGAHPFLAADLAQIAQKATGFLALLLIARRILALPWAPSIFAATLATALPALVQEIHHAQFAATGPALLALWMALESARTLLAGRHAAALAWGAPAALLYGLVLLTAFYVAWGTGLVTLLAALLLILAAPRDALSRLRPTPRGLATLAALATILALALLPALLLYLPLVRQTGLHARDLALLHGGQPHSLIAVGESSPLWGWMQGWITRRGRAPLQNGFAPFFWLLSLAALPLAWRRARAGDRRARLLLAAGGAALILSLMTVRYGGVWPWALIWDAVPGAHAFRVVPRIMFLGGPALVLLLAWMLWQASARSRALALALGALLLLDSWRAPLWMLDTWEELARMEALAPPTAGCTVFAASRAREGVPQGTIPATYSHNVDAMLVAARTNLPTINGYSTFLPPGWDLAEPGRPDYRERLQAEAARHGLLPGLCTLDMESLRWSGPDPR